MTPQEIEALRMEGLTDKVDSLSTMVELLKAERDALTAQVEVLQREFKDARTVLQVIAGCTWDSGANEIADIALDESKRWVSRYDDSVLSKTPQQCLRDVQAEAVMRSIEFFKPSLDIDTEALEAYAAKVRQGSA